MAWPEADQKHLADTKVKIYSFSPAVITRRRKNYRPARRNLKRPMGVGDSRHLSILRAIGQATLPINDALNQRVTELYEAHRDGIYRFLVTHGLPPAAAQEVTQDIFI